MARFSVVKFVIVPTGYLSYHPITDVYAIQEDGVNIKYDGKLIERMGSNSPGVPDVRIFTTGLIEVKAVFANPYEIQNIFGNLKVDPIPTAPVALSLFDVQVHTRKVSGASVDDEYHYITRLNILPTFDIALKLEPSFLAYNFQSTEESVYTIAGSEVIEVDD
jgi:hypothetical protein